MTQSSEARHMKQLPLCSSISTIFKHNKSVILLDKSCPEGSKGKEGSEERGFWRGGRRIGPGNKWLQKLKKYKKAEDSQIPLLQGYM